MNAQSTRRTALGALAASALSAALLAMPAPARAEGLLALGAKAPLATTKMKNVDGRELAIKDVAGKNGTLVIFSCNHCPYAKAWESRIVELGNDAQKKGIGVILINSNDPKNVAADGYEQMKDRAKAAKMEFPYVVDATSDLARAFGATKTPETFLFDKGGALVYRGAVDDNAYEPDKVGQRYLRLAIDAMLAGKPIAIAESKALGCSIKFRDKS